MVEIPDADNVNVVADDVPVPVEPGNAGETSSEGVGNQDTETPVDVEDPKNVDGTDDNDTTGTSDVGDTETKATDSPAASNSGKVTALLISFFASAIAAM